MLPPTVDGDIAPSLAHAYQNWRTAHIDTARRLPHKGRLYAALVVIYNLEDEYWGVSQLEEATSTDEGDFFGKRALRRHTSTRVEIILEEKGYGYLLGSGSLGETGRTSGGTKEAALDFIVVLRGGLNLLNNPEDVEKRSQIIDYLYHLVLDDLKLHAALGGIEADYSSRESIAAYISKIVHAETGNPGAVLQHLVGAKLERRYEGHETIEIAHNQASTNDARANRRGDFDLNSAVIHVTKSPTNDHYRKAKRNADSGRKAYLLVPESILGATRDFARQELGDPAAEKRINIWSVEQFVAQNLDELAVFDRGRALAELDALLDRYNELISEHENDQSLKVVKPDVGI